ncbi:uncharacterized protein LOC119084359 [Bradysia coprophila]|uniref:uncharacterized protein LOC119084359 n=1 Tax=Bradysia coprophila TaxID=38358 RepID=UPI00187DB04D|nr:uncharacterized protein LOC119084359 [Bradysia coprophila]XP_037050202.1 uncharacterized protein LOC119084359 [Bradysia coprophila]XP_037050203.1 uncharacterized protein LOC119084359 [Bradysia coprophila]
MESKMFTFGLVMLFCIIQSSSALKCYTCDSVSNPRCADIKDKGFQAQECLAENVLSQGAGFFGQFGLGGNNANKEPLKPTCLKIVTRNGTVGSVVARRCAVRTQDQDLCKLQAQNAGNNNQLEFCGVCDTDGCNSGNSMQLFSTLIVFGAMVCTARLFV